MFSGTSRLRAGMKKKQKWKKTRERERIHMKKRLGGTLTYSTGSDTGPLYLSSHSHLHTSTTSSLIFSHLPSFWSPTQTKTYGQRSFFYQSPSTWNGNSLRHSDSCTTFKSELKTNLYRTTTSLWLLTLTFLSIISRTYLCACVYIERKEGARAAFEQK